MGCHPDVGNPQKWLRGKKLQGSSGLTFFLRGGAHWHHIWPDGCSVGFMWKALNYCSWVEFIQYHSSVGQVLLVGGSFPTISFRERIFPGWHGYQWYQFGWLSFRAVDFLELTVTRTRINPSPIFWGHFSQFWTHVSFKKDMLTALEVFVPFYVFCFWSTTLCVIFLLPL